MDEDNKLMIEITKTAERILETLPANVTLVAAVKGRTIAEVEAVLNAGITHVGHNYVQEAQAMIQSLGDKATWHMIGHLQRNKANKAARLFDMIETIDSVRLAEAVNEQCRKMGKVMPVLIEINSGREASKTGVLPDKVDEFVAAVLELEYIDIQGLMTMGPRFGNPEDARPYFQATRKAFDRLSKLSHIDMRYLSMGMSNSYLIAIEEGANVIRIGTEIFGERI